MQRLPTVTAHIAVVIAALYHILSPMPIMFAWDLLTMVSFLIPLLTNLGNLTYASIKLLIFDRSPELTFYFKNIHCSLLNFLFLYSALTL